MSAVSTIAQVRHFDAMDPTTGKHHQAEDYDWQNAHDYSSAQEYNYGFAVHGGEMQHGHAYGRSYAHHTEEAQLVFPAQWPSMLTNPSAQAPNQVSIQPQIQTHPPNSAHMHIHQMSSHPQLAPMSAMTAAHALPPLNTGPVHNPPQRRTLTDQDRRRMCQYHEDNPSVKQTEIGAMFGVERSTVSKVLRQKDKYLFSDDGSRSPMKKAKGKFPDIERALSNWVRNHKRKGLSLSDKDIREKARFFATTVGSVDSFDKLNSNTWLEKFKQKNNLAGRKGRKGSDATESDAGAGNASESQTPNGISPVSPSGLTSPSPITPSQSMEKLRVETSNSALGRTTQNYNHLHSQSATSLTSGFTDTQAHSGATFLSDLSSAESTFGDTQSAHVMMNQANANSHRVRSQTFPVLGIDPHFGSAAGGANLTPDQVQDIMSNPTLETPIEEYQDRSFALHTETHASQPGSGVHTPAHSVSPAVMAPPSITLPNSTGQSALASPMSAPSQDEARQALELVMHFFQSQPMGVVDPEEYITMGKLMEKLKVQGSVGELPGGMHSIEMSRPEINRKRSVNSL